MSDWDFKTADLLGPSAYPAEQPQASEDEDMAAQPFPMLDPWGQPVLPPDAQQLYWREHGPNVDIAQVPFKGAKTIKVAGKTAYVSKVTPGLQDWAEDMGYKLAEYPGGGNMLDHMRVREDNELFNNGDPQFQPERSLQDREPSSYECPRCGEKLPDFGQFSLHMDEHDGRPEDDVQDGHFPGLPLGDEPLGFGTNPEGTAGDAIAHVAGMYHVAPVDAESSIAEHGLDWTRSTQPSWAAEAGDAEGNWLYADHPDKDQWMPGHEHVWEVNTDGLNPEHVWDNAHYVGQPITPDRLRRVAAKGNHPKDMIEAPVPFVYDIPTDKLHIGYEGTTTHEVPGKISPGGIVEGYYEPGGKITIQTYSTHPWSVRHLLDLWYHHAPQMEITGLEQTEKDGSTTKLAAEQGMHVGNYVKAMLQGSPAGLAVHRAMKEKYPNAKLYGVGGAPRDALMGKVPNDLDLLLQGVPQPEVEHMLKKLPGHADFAGKNYGVFHYYHPSGDHVEVALPRADEYEGGQRSKADVTVDPDMPIDEDLKRRDFTANSTAVDLDTGHFHDPLGGADDIKRNVLRASHPGSFAEDPTRLVRALTMHGRYGLQPDEQTRHDMEANGHLLRGESPDALRETFKKLIESNNPAAAIRLGKETGLLQHLLPEVDEKWDFDQNNPHHNYKLGDHLMQVLDNVSRLTPDHDVRLAALLHDIGKPESAWMDNQGVNHYYRKQDDLRVPWHTDENGKTQYDVSPDDEGGWGADHETVGAKLAGDILRKRLNMQRVRINRVQHLIQHHMFAPFTGGKGARRFMARVGDEHVDDLLNLREADQTGKGQTPEEVAAHTSAQNMRDLVENERLSAPTTGVNAISVNGKDLINMGMKPGPDMGKVLTQLQNHVIDDPSMNDRETLLGLAQQYVQASPSYSPQPDTPATPPV